MPRPTNTIRRAFFSHNARFLFLKDIKPPFGPHEYCRFHCYDTLTGRNVWNAFGTRPSFFSNDEQELYLYHGTSFEVRDVASGAILRNLPAKTGINEAWLSMNGTTLISVRLNYVQSPTRYFRQRAR
jgi:hypothetical protein